MSRGDPRIARIEMHVKQWLPAGVYAKQARAAQVDLRAWQEIAERHSGVFGICRWCAEAELWPCLDREAADAALDRLDALWGAG